MTPHRAGNALGIVTRLYIRLTFVGRVLLDRTAFQTQAALSFNNSNTTIYIFNHIMKKKKWTNYQSDNPPPRSK